MALYPLCHHGEEPEAAIRHAAEVIEKTASDVLDRRDFLTFLGIYAKMKYPLVDAANIIGREKMRESAFAQEWVAEGREEGSLMTRRTDIHEILADRFGRRPRAVRRAPEIDYGLGGVESIVQDGVSLRHASRSSRPPCPRHYRTHDKTSILAIPAGVLVSESLTFLMGKFAAVLPGDRRYRATTCGRRRRRRGGGGSASRPTPFG